MMDVHVTLRIFDGIPEEPQIFASRDEAYMVWIVEASTATWRDGYYTDEHHLEMYHYAVFTLQEAQA